MTVAEYIAKFLADNNMNDVFLMDGAAAAQMIVAVANEPRLGYYCNWHEQAGGFSIDGYFRSSGRMATMICTSGPATQNLCNPIATMWYDSIPGLFITGNVNSKFMKPNDQVRQHGFQEHDVVEMVKSFTKSAVQLKVPTNIRYYLERLVYLAKTGRPGPVLLDVPMDIQKVEIDESKLKGYTFPTYFEHSRDPVEKYNINFILDKLYAAKRPMILIGGGVKLAKAEWALRVLLSCLHIPFAVTWNAIDFAESDDPLYAGRVGTFGGDGRNFAIQNCDCLLTIGSRISGRITGGMIESFARDAYKIIIDIDRNELEYQQVNSNVSLIMDAKKFIDYMLDEFAARAYKYYKEEDGGKEWLSTKFDDWTKQVIDWRNKYRVYKPEYEDQKISVNPYVFIKELSKQIDNQSIIITDIGSNCVVTHQCWDTKLGQKIFSNNGNASLGYALPAAIGAAIANPDKQIICITGDGGLNFNIQELQTIITYNLNIKIFIFNNDMYGMTKAFRDTNCNSNYAGCDRAHGVSMPDFWAIAKAYGVEAARCYEHQTLDWNIQKSLDYKGAYLLDVNMKGFYDYVPKLNYFGPIEDMYPFLPRDEFKSNMLIEPIEGWEKHI